MAEAGILDVLIGATPYLTGGFALNLAISLGAMALGTAVGTALGGLRRGLTAWPAGGVTQVTRNVPSFVLLFFLAAVLPERIGIAGFAWPVGPVATAILALAIPVAGFTSDAVRDLRTAPPGARPARWSALTFAYVQYFVIILMASATASVIGVEEIVARSNHLVTFEADVARMLGVYAYTALWFMVTGITLLRLGRWASTAVGSRASAAAHSS